VNATPFRLERASAPPRAEEPLPGCFQDRVAFSKAPFLKVTRGSGGAKQTLAMAFDPTPSIYGNLVYFCVLFLCLFL